MNPLPEAAEQTVADPADDRAGPQNRRHVDDVAELPVGGPGRTRGPWLRQQHLQGPLRNSRHPRMGRGRGRASGPQGVHELVLPGHKKTVTAQPRIADPDPEIGPVSHRRGPLNRARTHLSFLARGAEHCHVTEANFLPQPPDQSCAPSSAYLFVSSYLGSLLQTPEI